MGIIIVLTECPPIITFVFCLILFAVYCIANFPIFYRKPKDVLENINENTTNNINLADFDVINPQCKQEKITKSTESKTTITINGEKI